MCSIKGKEKILIEGQKSIHFRFEKNKENLSKCPQTRTRTIKAVPSNHNDTRLENTALCGVVGQTTKSGFVPANTQSTSTPAQLAHNCCRERPNCLHPDAPWVKTCLHVCGSYSHPSMPQTCINPSLHSSGALTPEGVWPCGLPQPWLWSATYLPAKI